MSIYNPSGFLPYFGGIPEYTGSTLPACHPEKCIAACVPYAVGPVPPCYQPPAPPVPPYWTGFGSPKAPPTYEQNLFDDAKNHKAGPPGYPPLPKGNYPPDWVVEYSADLPPVPPHPPIPRNTPALIKFAPPEAPSYPVYSHNNAAAADAPAAPAQPSPPQPPPSPEDPDHPDPAADMLNDLRAADAVKAQAVEPTEGASPSPPLPPLQPPPPPVPVPPSPPPASAAPAESPPPTPVLLLPPANDARPPPPPAPTVMTYDSDNVLFGVWEDQLDNSTALAVAAAHVGGGAPLPQFTYMPTLAALLFVLVSVFIALRRRARGAAAAAAQAPGCCIQTRFHKLPQRPMRCFNLEEMALSKRDDRAYGSFADGERAALLDGDELGDAPLCDDDVAADAPVCCVPVCGWGEGLAADGVGEGDMERSIADLVEQEAAERARSVERVEEADAIVLRVVEAAPDNADGGRSEGV